MHEIDPRCPKEGRPRPSGRRPASSDGEPGSPRGSDDGQGPRPGQERGGPASLGDDPGESRGLPGAPSSGAEYTIAAVSKLTGINRHTLRIWERRYGIPSPHRSASGHRRYGRDQVEVLRRIAVLARDGMTIGQLMARLREGRLDVSGVRDPVALLLDRLLAGDDADAEARYRRLAEDHGPIGVVVGVIDPALVDIGERWFRGECDASQARCAGEFLRRKLEALIDATRRVSIRPTRTIIVGTVQGDRHEGGALIFQHLMEWAGWRVLNLGVDLPASEFEKAVARWAPDALGVSFILSRNINKRFRELARIRSLPVFVGGRGILNYQTLARRHGFIPIAGSGTDAVERLLCEFAARCGGSSTMRPGGVGGPPA